jgi:hypothetical protein
MPLLVEFFAAAQGAKLMVSVGRNGCHDSFAPQARGLVGHKERGMTRTCLAVVALAAALAAPAAHAQGSPENDDSRFTFHRADDGYLRLDGRSGQVSLCERRPAGWQCQAVPDERAALEGEIARLQANNARLKKELLAHNLPLPGGLKPDLPSRGEDATGGLPSDAELNRIMSFIEKVWKRMVEMIVSTQKDMMKKS